MKKIISSSDQTGFSLFFVSIVSISGKSFSTQPFLQEIYYAVKRFSTYGKPELSPVKPKNVKKNKKTIFTKRFLDILKMSIFPRRVDFFIYFLQLLQTSLYSKIQYYKYQYKGS